MRQCPSVSGQFEQLSARSLCYMPQASLEEATVGEPLPKAWIWPQSWDPHTHRQWR